MGFIYFGRKWRRPSRDFVAAPAHAPRQSVDSTPSRTRALRPTLLQCFWPLRDRGLGARATGTASAHEISASTRFLRLSIPGTGPPRGPFFNNNRLTSVTFSPYPVSFGDCRGFHASAPGKQNLRSSALKL